MRQAYTYKIWAVIERCSPQTDEYEDVSEPACLGEYDDLNAAQAHLDAIDIYPKRANKRGI